ncbi:LPXTG cell wall anchor domain-containing protein [Streptomyces kronopolitis]|uniref:LPXTG cell wall anchor domain-containing protein n=1 Tax=Streptomyces kronopolitis TaxID=1612435 RepID=UPI0020C09CA2|nr:LPXTG cell wall anchor domain-containing protein [Streptomyces kronopolitis]MCL6300065.1 LPXTG cell wall anchor domain-containing protein [Streptomyces kronopolitis]
MRIRRALTAAAAAAVLAPAAVLAAPAAASATEPVSASGPGPDPQGGAHLAVTGSSSTLPAIALIGGAAMLVGAGAVLGTRRRRGAAGPDSTDDTE